MNMATNKKFLACLIFFLGLSVNTYCISAPPPPPPHGSTNLTKQNISTASPVTQFAAVTFYLPTGNLPSATPTCPEESSSGPTQVNQFAGAVYNGSLSSVGTIYAGFTCVIAVGNYSGQNLTQALTAPPYNVTGTSPSTATACKYVSGTFNGTAYNCFQGNLSDLNSVTANTSVCFNDLPVQKICSPYNAGEANYNVGVYSYANPSSPGTMTIANGTGTPVSVPLCSANSPLLFNLSGNATLKVSYSRAWNYGESCDPSNCGHFFGSVTCNSEDCPPTNGAQTPVQCHGTGTCSQAAFVVTAGSKNSISLSIDTTETDYIGDNQQYPFVWMTGGSVCLIPTTASLSTPISP